MASFSQRRQGGPPEITIREAAPAALRWFVLETAKGLGCRDTDLRNLVCRRLRRAADPRTLAFAIDAEIQQLIGLPCSWSQFYDLIEDLYRWFQKEWQKLVPHLDVTVTTAAEFAALVNEFFLEEGIGWQLVDGQIVVRGEEGFERAKDLAETELTQGGRPTAAKRIHEAIADLSRRPQADFSGAVDHAIAAVECVLGDATGQTKGTLGDFLKQYPFEPSLKKGLEGLWGYACNEGARHGKEGVEPGRTQAEFIVTICAGLTTLLNDQNPRSPA